WMLRGVVVLVLAANTINIGADLGAMADALKLLVGGPQLAYVVTFGVGCAALQIFMHYDRYAIFLKWLTLALLAYFGTAMVVQVPGGEVAYGLLVPTFSSKAAFWTTVVALLGTTISPYLFFWQASQEVEDLRADDRAKPLKQAPQQAPRELE